MRSPRAGPRDSGEQKGDLELNFQDSLPLFATICDPGASSSRLVPALKSFPTEC
jgi:hypothetical protein